MSMKRISIVLLALTIGFFIAADLFAADKAAIQKNVDDIVAAIDGGKNAADFKANDYDPYVFILEEGGMTLVHPSLIGKSLKDVAGPVYEALVKATPEGLWVEYIWKEKKKHTYVRKTKENLIVGSGYSE
jgi:adenosyl cobinamide kinase/adenosyl cobinamide phosphate guanylyltransferase